MNINEIKGTRYAPQTLTQYTHYIHITWEFMYTYMCVSTCTFTESTAIWDTQIH